MKNQKQNFKNYDMPKLREAIAFAYACNVIDELEYTLLYNANKPGNPNIPYFVYNEFHLNLLATMVLKWIQLQQPAYF